MSKRAIVLGLGGTGKQAVFSLRERLLQDAGSIVEIKNIQFLVLDTDKQNVTFQQAENDKKEIVKETESTSLSNDEFLPLIVNQDTMENLKNSIRNDTFKQRFPQLSPWLSTDLILPLPKIEDGAGQVRQIGRLGFQMNCREFEEKIANTVLNLVNLKQAGVSTSKSFYIVSSLLGGTGAGIWMDVIHFLRENYPDWELISILISSTGDTFGGYPDCRHNCYTSLVEMNHYFGMSSDDDNHKYKLTFNKNKVVNKPILERCYIISEKNFNGDIIHDSIKELPKIAALQIYLDVMNDDASGKFSADRNNSLQSSFGYNSNDSRGSQCLFWTFGLSTIEYPLELITNICIFRFLRETFGEILGKDSTIPTLSFDNCMSDFKIKENINSMIPQLNKEGSIREIWATQMNRILENDVFGQTTEFKKIFEMLQKTITTGEYDKILEENTNNYFHQINEQIKEIIAKWFTDQNRIEKRGVGFCLDFLKKFKQFISNRGNFEIKKTNENRQTITNLLLEINKVENQRFATINKREEFIHGCYYGNQKHSGLIEIGARILEDEIAERVNINILTSFFNKLEKAIGKFEEELISLQNKINNVYITRYIANMEENSRSLLFLKTDYSQIVLKHRIINEESDIEREICEEAAIVYQDILSSRLLDAFLKDHIQTEIIKTDNHSDIKLSFFRDLGSDEKYMRKLAREARLLVRSYLKEHPDTDIIRVFNEMAASDHQKKTILTKFFKKSGVLLNFSSDEYLQNDASQLQFMNFVGWNREDDGIKEKLIDPSFSVDKYNRILDRNFFTTPDKHRMICYREFGAFPIRIIRDISKLKEAYNDKVKYSQREFFSEKGKVWDKIENPPKAEVIQAVSYLIAGSLIGIIKKDITEKKKIRYNLSFGHKSLTKYENPNIGSLGVEIAIEKELRDELKGKIDNILKSESGLEKAEIVFKYQKFLELFNDDIEDRQIKFEIGLMKESIADFAENTLKKIGFVDSNNSVVTGDHIKFCLNRKEMLINFYCPFCKKDLPAKLPEKCINPDCNEKLNAENLFEALEFIFGKSICDVLLPSQFSIPKLKTTRSIHPETIQTQEFTDTNRKPDVCPACNHPLSSLEDDDNFCPEERCNFRLKCECGEYLIGSLCAVCNRFYESNSTSHKTVLSEQPLHKCPCCETEIYDGNSKCCPNPKCDIVIKCNECGSFLKTQKKCTNCGRKYPDNKPRSLLTK